MTYPKDTIAARATAPGRGGIGIVRVSGPKSAEIATRMLGRVPVPRYATYAKFLNSDETVIDEGIALFFPGPDSFTGEDVLELQGHGGPVVLNMLLNRITRLGARLAGPGEFSQRAYLNDKIDLAQAEAIADLIDSSTEAAARGAIRSLQGEFSEQVSALLSQVIELRVFVEAAIDFPEEEIDFISDANVAEKLAGVRATLDSLLDHSRQGALLSEGATVALVGKPNAGKSSLMNALAGRDVSIVTDVPGTTRDIVGETMQIDGIPLRLVDTAGIRESNDVVESEGVKRALAAREEADLILHVLDATVLTEPSDFLSGLANPERIIIVVNKVDLVEPSVNLSAAADLVTISAKTGAGLADLRQLMKAKLGVTSSETGTFTARARHLVALEAASAALQTGEQVLAETMAGELLAEELKCCQEHLSDITGEFTADDLLGEIFGSFCIGK